MARKTPQEKKALSYAKDGRNGYGENDKSSRKAIPLYKRLVNRANRHHAQRLLAAASGVVNADVAEAAETRAQGKRPKRWTKVPDTRLGEYLANKAGRRPAGD